MYFPWADLVRDEPYIVGIYNRSVTDEEGHRWLVNDAHGDPINELQTHNCKFHMPLDDADDAVLVRNLCGAAGQPVYDTSNKPLGSPGPIIKMPGRKNGQDKPNAWSCPDGREHRVKDITGYGVNAAGITQANFSVGWWQRITNAGIVADEDGDGYQDMSGFSEKTLINLKHVLATANDGNSDTFEFKATLKFRQGTNTCLQLTCTLQDDNNTVTLQPSSDDNAWSQIITNNEWHYIVCTFDGSTRASLYVDGRFAVAQTGGAIPATGDFPTTPAIKVSINGDVGTSGTAFAGVPDIALAHLCLYDTELKLPAITRKYQAIRRPYDFKIHESEDTTITAQRKIDGDWPLQTQSRTRGDNAFDTVLKHDVGNDGSGTMRPRMHIDHRDVTMDGSIPPVFAITTLWWDWQVFQDPMTQNMMANGATVIAGLEQDAYPTTGSDPRANEVRIFDWYDSDQLVAYTYYNPCSQLAVTVGAAGEKHNGLRYRYHPTLGWGTTFAKEDNTGSNTGQSINLGNGTLIRDFQVGGMIIDSDECVLMSTRYKNRPNGADDQRSATTLTGNTRTAPFISREDYGHAGERVQFGTYGREDNNRWGPFVLVANKIPEDKLKRVSTLMHGHVAQRSRPFLRSITRHTMLTAPQRTTQ